MYIPNEEDRRFYEACKKSGTCAEFVRAYAEFYEPKQPPPKRKYTRKTQPDAAA